MSHLDSDLDTYLFHCALQHLDNDWLRKHAIFCNTCNHRWGVEDAIYYHLPSKTFCRLTIEACGVDLTDEKCVSAEVISHEEAMALLSDRSKERLKKSIQEAVENERA